MPMSKLGKQHSTSGDSLRASTTMNPEQSVMLPPNLASPALRTQDRGTLPTLQVFGLVVSESRCCCISRTTWSATVEALHIIPRTALWRRQRAWSPLSRSCLMVIAPTVSQHNTLQHVCLVSVCVALSLETQSIMGVWCWGICTVYCMFLHLLIRH